MHQIYDVNNLVFWSEEEIEERARLAEAFSAAMRRFLQDRNRAWRFERVESPMLIPRELLSEEYDEDKIFAIPPRATSIRLPAARALSADRAAFDRLASHLPPDFDIENAWAQVAIAALDEAAAAAWDRRLDPLALAWARSANRAPKELALRPETTPATYAWMARRLSEKATLLPYCCWQLAKSFRREQDQSSRHMRLKEFWQEEFQCAHSSDTLDDWQAVLAPQVKELIAELTRCPARLVVSDRLPAYSVCTVDVEVWNSQKWMEICSISKRVDFPLDAPIPQKANAPAREALVVEVATSPDRQYHCQRLWRPAWENLPREAWIDHDLTPALVSNQAAAELRAAWRASREPKP